MIDFAARNAARLGKGKIRNTMRAGSEKTQIAVFDFDGTCIRGSSTVSLVLDEIGNRYIGPSVMLRIAGWAFCYKLHLPQNESWVRGLVFKGFAGWKKGEVDAYLSDFYDRKVERRWRPQARRTIENLSEAGYTVVIVSATFDRIAARAIDGKPIHSQVSTCMELGPNGEYTGRVDGNPVEGPEKLAAFRKLADAEFGKGQWELAYCFGDHYSDREIMQAAVHPIAISPDATLARHARKHGWGVLDWDDPSAPALQPDRKGSEAYE